MTAMNVMKDLETWGTRPGSALRSIGAVTFDPFDPEAGGETFYRNIDDESQLAAGLVKSESTIKWWQNVPVAAQKVLTKDQRPLQEVVDEFHAWFNKHKGLWIWSQGANFDTVLWECAAMAVGRSVPWRFSNVRDTRTAYEMGRLEVYKMARKGTHHNALDDAKHQVVCVQAAYRRIKVTS